MASRAAPAQQASSDIGEIAYPIARLVPPPSTTACTWPALDTLGLSADARADRVSCIGGSDANIIMSGDENRVLQLWREKRGQAEPEDLSAVLPVMLGLWTETFNRHWYERSERARVSECGSLWTSIVHPWRKATLDGLVEDKRAVWEAKHVNAFAKPDEVLTRYMPQLQHNMAVAGLERAVLSVIYGNHKWEAYEVAADWLYQDELLAAEQRFWESLSSGVPPVAVAPPPPPRPIACREVCFEGNNAWAAAADSWRTHSEAAKAHAAAVRDIKALVEDDVTRAHGHGIEAKRSKSGAISIRECGQ